VKNLASEQSDRVRYFRLDKRSGPGAARNEGAKVSQGDILAFVDADMTFEKNYVEELVKPIANGEVSMTHHGKEYVANVDNPWVRCQGSIERSSSNKEWQEVPRAIKRDLFLDFGGFDPSKGYHDDRTFYQKTKLRAKVIQSAVCYHYNPDTAQEVFRQFLWQAESLFTITGGLNNSFKEFFKRIHILSEALLPFFILLFLLRPYNYIVDLLFSLSLIEFLIATAKHKYLAESISTKEKVIYRVLYIPVYRWLRAIGYLAGIVRFTLRDIIV
jgi:glycosyltransferase involved in cell wall biosynthesis